MPQQMLSTAGRPTCPESSLDASPALSGANTDGNRTTNAPQPPTSNQENCATNAPHPSTSNQDVSSAAVSQAKYMTNVVLTRVSSTINQNLRPDRPLGPPRVKGVLQSVYAVLIMSWFNTLLICIPVSWALHFIWKEDATGAQHTIVFAFSFLSIVPLAQLLALTTDDLSCRVGHTLAGLISVTLRNTPELIIAIIALTQCQVQIVQSSLVGSILSDILLFLGMSLFAGGTRFSEQGLNARTARMDLSLLTVSVIAVLLPAAFHFSLRNEEPTENLDIMGVSHVAAVVLPLAYASYLIFQLISHRQDPTDPGSERLPSTLYRRSKLQRRMIDGSRSPPAAEHVGLPIMHNTQDTRAPQYEHKQDDSETEVPMFTLSITVGILVTVAAIVGMTAEIMINSIDGLTSTGRISKGFVSHVLLPVVSNVSDYAIVCTVAMKDKIDVVIDETVGASIQIALLAMPLLVALGWIMDKPLTFLFDPYDSIVLFLSALVVMYTIRDGRSNWLMGFLFILLYVMLAATFWYYPGGTPDPQC